MPGSAPKRQKITSNSFLTSWLGKTPPTKNLQNSSNKENCGSPSKHRQSGIDPEWKKDFPWLVISEDQKGMLCKVCMKFNVRPKNGSAVWVSVPCSVLFRESLNRHSKSKFHQDAQDLEAHSVLAEQGKGIQALLDQHCSLEKTAIIGAFRCIFWLAKEEIPHTTHFSSLMNLAKEMGCNYMNLLKKGGNVNYTSQRTMQEMLDCISDQINSPIFQQLVGSKFFSLMIDETTDIAVTKQMSVMARYFDSEKQLKTSFLALIDLKDGKADTIVAALKKFMMDRQIPCNKLIGLGSDGASVMVGKKSGVATQLKVTNPEMINVHCIAHRLALAAAQATDDIPYLKKFKAIMHQLFKFYQNSSVRMEGLKEIESVLGGPTIKLKNIADTRWLSHEHAVSAVRLCLPALIISLEREASERMDATAAGLATFVKNPFFLCTIAMLSDVLPHLNRLSKIFQRTAVDFTLVDPMVSATQMALLKLLENPGHYMTELPDKFQELAEYGMKETSTSIEDFKDQVYKKYITNVIDNLHERFPDNRVLDSLSVFDPELITTEDNADLQTIEMEKIKILANQFKSIGDFEAAKEEFLGLKMLIKQNMSDLSIHQVMEKVIKLSDVYPIMSAYCEIGLLIPVSTADCERSFSAMKRIKSVLRNRICQNTLNNLMTISLEGPGLEEFDFNSCVSKFGQIKKRKICTV